MTNVTKSDKFVTFLTALVRIKILAQASKGVERRVAEAYQIFTLKPTLNGKEELEGLELIVK